MLALLATCFMLVSCLAYSSALKMEATWSSKMLLDFNRLHSGILQKVELTITTAVRTSNATNSNKLTGKENRIDIKHNGTSKYITELETRNWNKEKVSYECNMRGKCTLNNPGKLVMNTY
jgi:hemin uptake protein HemP